MSNMIYNIPAKLNELIRVKGDIKDIIDSVGNPELDTSGTFRSYASLISQIADSGAMTREEYNTFEGRVINIIGNI